MRLKRQMPRLTLRRYFDETKKLEIIDRIPFSSKRKYMGVTLRENGREKRYCLGAPEYLTDDRATISKAERFAAEGMRVLLLTEKEPVALVVLSDIIKEDGGNISVFPGEKCGDQNHFGR